MNRLGRVLGNVLAVILTVFSLQVLADTPQAGRDFNHMTTGFPLSGGHATAACETCHVGGVFKGTAKTCDGCHALGKRVTATPKPTNHLVTDSPCESCHFNTYTFLDARYNHGIAQPGQCATCHNGLVTAGRPASHNAGLKLTGSCDNCHRTYSFLPASWNHSGVTPGSCATAGCHVPGSNQYSVVNHVYSPKNYGLMMTTPACDACHNFISWIPRHIAPTGLCSSCHDDVKAKGPLSYPGHMTIPAGQDCQSCHTSTSPVQTSSWAGGVFNHAAAGVVIGGSSCSTGSGCHATGSTNRFTASSHIYTPKNYTLMMTTPGCDSCHMSFSNWTPTHINPAAPPCNSCHGDVKAKGPGSFLGHTTISVGQDCQQCHASTTPSQTSSWAGGAGMPINHIPFNAGMPCNICHVGASGYTTPVNTNTLHANSSSHTCAECHISPNAYTGSPNTQKTKSSHSGSSGSNCTGCHTHQSAGSYNSWGG